MRGQRRTRAWEGRVQSGLSALRFDAVRQASARMVPSSQASAATRGLIADPSAWFVSQSAGNETSHIYNADKAREVHAKAVTFADDAEEFLVELTGRLRARGPQRPVDCGSESAMLNFVKAVMGHDLNTDSGRAYRGLGLPQARHVVPASHRCAGRRRCVASSATTKTEAKRLVGDMERRYERQRFGSDPKDLEDGGGTVDALMEWWVETCLSQAASDTGVSSVRKHIIGTALGQLA